MTISAAISSGKTEATARLSIDFTTRRKHQMHFKRAVEQQGDQQRIVVSGIMAAYRGLPIVRHEKIGQGRIAREVFFGCTLGATTCLQRRLG